jgi:tetratricopeptide (TPR) repeat protein
MLTGNRPFGGGYEAAVAYAILNEDPPPVAEVNPETDGPLSELVAACLAKSSTERVQTCLELSKALAPYSGVSETGTIPVAGGTVSRRGAAVAHSEAPSNQKTALIFSAIAAVVLSVVYGAMIGLGLPDWVFPTAVLLMLAGLPIVLYSTAVERKRDSLETGEREKLTGIAAWLTRKRAFQGGIAAIGLLVVATSGYVILKSAGVGPFATLISGGTLTKQDLLIVADFDNQTSDPALGATVSEAFRIDLSQSTAVRLLDKAGVQTGLTRMQINPDTLVSTDIALQLAAREAVKAVIVGDVQSAGAGFSLNAKILSGVDGSQLAAFRETARSDADILDAIDRLSADLREAIGESLVDIRGNEPLEQVTTGSIEALRLYSEGERLSNEGLEIEAIERLKQAISIDSSFAMAYRKLSVLYNNTRADDDLANDAATKAYDLRDRLTVQERMLTEAYYQSEVENDRDEEIRIYEDLLKRYPYTLAALNNLAIRYTQRNEPEKAEVLIRRALEVTDGTTFRSNLTQSLAYCYRRVHGIVSARTGRDNE